jgi:peptidoglycan/xylan/chitin deacetylase (PgdA/CDA1 family)
MAYLTLRFDDGTMGQYTNAFNIMRKYDMVGSIFVIGNRFREDHKSESYIQLPELLEMQEAGWEIGYHSWSHDWKWVNLPNEFAKQSDCSFLKEKGLKISSFCFPYGLYTEDSIKYIANRYKALVGKASKDGDSINHLPSQNLFKSFSIKPDTPISKIEDRIRLAIINKEYLILMFHRIEPEFISNQKFSSILTMINQYRISKKIKILTLKKARRKIKKNNKNITSI